MGVLFGYDVYVVYFMDIRFLKLKGKEMIKSKDVSVFNPFTDKYVDCYCEFECYYSVNPNDKALYTTLISATSPSDVELYSRIPSDERLEIEEKMEKLLREEMV